MLFYSLITLILLVSKMLRKEQYQIALVAEFLGSEGSIPSKNNVKLHKYREPPTKVKAMTEEIITYAVAMSNPGAQDCVF